MTGRMSQGEWEEMIQSQVDELITRMTPAEKPALGAPDRIMAGPKHLAGYGGALGGRDYDEVNLSDSELCLSYGRFKYANLTVDPPAVTTRGTVTVSVEVTNTADREADEVVQLYIHQRYGSASRPVRELKRFRRVTPAAGESRTIEFPVGASERRYWNAAVRDWVTDSSTFDVWAGGDSTARLATSFEVTAE
jgi:hypothetical protein